MSAERAAGWVGILALHIAVAVPVYAAEMPRFLKNLTTPKEGREAPLPPSDEAAAPGGGSVERSPRDSAEPGRRGSAEENAGSPKRSARGATTGGEVGGRGSVSAADSGSDADGPRVKEIKRGVTKASVVLDKHCPRIVQPYRLTDNVASVGTFTAQEGMKGIGNAFSNFNPGKSRSPPPQNVDIPASTKLAAKQMNWLPMRAEVLYGERSHNEETNVLDRESRLGQKFYPIADKMLQQVLSNVREPHEYEFKLFILKNATRNAYARPGGFVYLDQGLIDSSAQHPKAFFALAHEIAHVLQRHETKELQSMIVDSIQTKNDLTKVMSRVRTDPGVILGHVKIQKNLFTQHHVDQELQSDSCAARLLSRVFPDPQQLANALQAFLKDLPKPTADKAAKRPQNDAEKIAATAHSIVNDPVKRHPTTQQRYENLRAIYNEIVGGAPTKQR